MVSLCRSASKKYVIRFTNVRCRCDCFHVTSQRGLSFGKALYLIAFIFKTSVSVYFWFLLTLYSAEAIIVPHRMVWSWYTGCWWVSCYIWYSEEGTGGGAAARPGPSSMYQLSVFRCSSVYSISRTVLFLRYSVSNNGLNLKSGLEVTQGHLIWYHSKAWVRYSIRIPLLSFVSFPRQNEILAENRDVFIPPCIWLPRYGGRRRLIAIPFGRKTWMGWLSNSERVWNV